VKRKKTVLWKCSLKSSLLVAVTVMHVGLSHFSAQVMYLFCLFLESGSHYVYQAGLKLDILLNL
jgi:hypothetical protein